MFPTIRTLLMPG